VARGIHSDHDTPRYAMQTASGIATSKPRSTTKKKVAPSETGPRDKFMNTNSRLRQLQKVKDKKDGELGKGF